MGKTFTLATNGANALSAIPSMVKIIPAFGKMYFVDGLKADYKYFDPTDNTVHTWTPSAGALPTDGGSTLGATIGTLYNGRVVLAGLTSDPQNWFMSASGDPLDWDYGEVPFTATSPVAGNNSLAGKVGDCITCLAPYNDDLMVMGGVQSTWLMRGDPANGGRIDAISRSIGITGPDAWCLDPQGNMYFFGGGVLYRMKPFGSSTQYSTTLGNLPEPLSSHRLDKTFGAVDGRTNQVLLMWDETLHGVHIYISPLNEGPSFHWWWDSRTDGFWKEQYPENCGPSAVYVYQDPDSTIRADLVGGYDGIIRQIDPAAKSDDGTPITSSVKFAPINPGSTHQDARINRLITVLDPDSDPVSINLYAGQSPEETVVGASVVWAYLASPSFRYGIPRVRGNTVLVEIANMDDPPAWTVGVDYKVGDRITPPSPYELVAPIWVCVIANTSADFATDTFVDGDWAEAGFRSWSLESIAMDMEIVGRTRHGRI